MSERNYLIHEYFMKKIENYEPELAFKGKSQEDFKSWHRVALEKLKEIVGEFPNRVPLNSEVLSTEECDGLIREKIVFDSEEFMSVPCYVLRPKDMTMDKSNAAILCSHGHGFNAQFGKEPVAGFATSPKMKEELDFYNYNYAEQMAKRGYLTIAPDLRGFGERGDTEAFPIKDSCNSNYVQGSILGLFTLTLNIWDMMCCIDYLETRPEVDNERIGMMGLSGGGTMTTFTSALDSRIKAADIMGYINSFGVFGIERGNFCGMQILPNIYKYFDTDEIAGLIAPRPLLIEMNENDQCFYFKDLMKGFEGVEEIYKAAGRENDLWRDTKPRDHCFNGDKAFDFFDKYL